MDKDTDTIRTCNGMIADFVEELAEAYGDSSYEVVSDADGHKSIVTRDVPGWLRERAEGLRNEGPADIEREKAKVQAEKDRRAAWDEEWRLRKAERAARRAERLAEK